MRLVVSSTAVNDDFDVDDALAYCHRQVHRSLDALGRDQSITQ